MDMFFAAQLVGFVAAGFSIAQMQFRCPRRIFLSGVPICGLWAFQYVLLGAFGGLAANLVNIMRCLSILIPARHRISIYWALNGAVLSLSWWTWSGWIDSMVVIAGLVGNLSILRAENRFLVAISIMIGCLCWIIYNYTVGSWMGLTTAILVIVSNLIGMARYEGWLKPKTPALQAAE